MARFEIVFFDAGGTLLCPEPGVGEVYAAAGRRFGLDAEPAAMEAAFREAFQAKRHQLIPQDREWWRSVVEETFARFGKLTDGGALFDTLYDHFARPDAWRLLSNVVATLDELARRGYRTGLISNWDDRLPGLLSELGLLERLDPVVVSYRVGAEKPDERIFRAALDEAGVDPPRALMVGDDPMADVDGARAVGMHAIRIDPEAPSGDSSTVVRSFQELLELLA